MNSLRGSSSNFIVIIFFFILGYSINNCGYVTYILPLFSFYIYHNLLLHIYFTFTFIFRNCIKQKYIQNIFLFKFKIFQQSDGISCYFKNSFVSGTLTNVPFNKGTLKMMLVALYWVLTMPNENIHKNRSYVVVCRAHWVYAQQWHSWLINKMKT